MYIDCPQCGERVHSTLTVAHWHEVRTRYPNSRPAACSYCGVYTGANRVGGQQKPEQREQQQENYDEQIKFVDKQGNAVKHASYKLYSYNKELSSGTSDGNGMTNRVTTKDKTKITKATIAVNDLKLDADLDGMTTNSTDFGSSIVTKTLPLDTVEVIVSDKRIPSRTSMFGHVAIEVNGTVYSQGPRGYEKERTHSEYIGDNCKFRDSWGYVLRVLPIEKGTIENELNRRVARYKGTDKPQYDILVNSCSSNIVEVLGLVGIIANDPRWGGVMASSPADVDIALSRSKRLIEKRNYPKVQS
jgi:hypothetical protein